MSTPEDSPVRYRFVGESGEYINGIPARDLSDAEVYDMTPDQKDVMKAHLSLDPEQGHHVLYERVKPSKGEKGADVTRHKTPSDDAQEVDGSSADADTAG